MNLYKQSQFNVEVLKEQDHIVLYNSYSGSVCRLENDLYKIICGGLFDNAVSSFEELLDQGFIVPAEENEVDIILSEERERRDDLEEKSKLLFIIAPTLKCNLRCFYCFESNQNDNEIMSDEVIDDTVDYILKSTNLSTKHIHIKWFGGEPMLAFEQIIRMSEKLKERLHGRSIAFSSSMITNGILLDREKVKKLISVANLNEAQITLDGRENEYCRRKGAMPSDYSSVIKNIKDCADYIKTVIRLNYDRENFLEVLSLLQELFPNKTISPRVQISLGELVAYNGKSRGEFVNYIEADEYHIRILEWLKDNYPDYIPPRDLPKKRIVFCGLKCMKNMAIGPNGDLYKCEHDFGDNSRSVGNVKTGLSQTQYLKAFMDLKLSDKCKSCKLLPLCLGGCPSVRLFSGKENCVITEKIVTYMIKDFLFKKEGTVNGNNN